jgi:SAM-dependent methyltransferase
MIEIFNIENWMLPKEAIEWIFENVPEGSTILELGSGYGTEILSKSYKMYSIEQNEDWLNKFDSNYIYAPIVDGFYSRECLKNITKEYDLLIIDGPTKLSGGRLGLIENIDLFNLDCDILIDDVHREDELKLLIEISKILKKDYIIIFCDNKKFGIIKTK